VVAVGTVESNRRYTRPDPRLTIHIATRLASAAICEVDARQAEIVHELLVFAVALASRIDLLMIATSDGERVDIGSAEPAVIATAESAIVCLP
jgi:hypothetical protein